MLWVGSGLTLKATWSAFVRWRLGFAADSRSRRPSGGFVAPVRCALLAVTLCALGVTTRAQTEIEKLRERAAHGEPGAFNALGNAHASGQGVPRDDAAALAYYQQAAERGVPEAWFNLGMFHELGRGTPADIAAAFKLYLKAAERGFPSGQFNVGNMYANGIGVKQNLQEAAIWFRKAAEQGVQEAQFNLGLAHELGRGVLKDEGLAIRWYRRAALQGNARAQYSLALMLDEGRGVAADPALALSLYRAAAMQNFAPAQNNLGLLLAAGRGAPADPVEASAWLTLAVENGLPSDAREVLVQRLSPAQFAEANAALGRLRSELGIAPLATAVPNQVAVAPPAGGQDPLTAELMALKTRLAAVEGEAKKFRDDNIRLAEIADAAQRSRAELERRLAETKNPARSPVAATDSTSLAAGAAPDQAELDQLAAANPVVGRLASQNAELNEKVKQTSLEIAQLHAQLRILQNGGSPSTPSSEVRSAAPDDNRVELLTRRIEVMRSTIDKLAQESRWNAGVNATLDRLRLENEQLKSARRSVR